MPACTSRATCALACGTSKRSWPLLPNMTSNWWVTACARSASAVDRLPGGRLQRAAEDKQERSRDQYLRRGPRR